MRKRSAPATFSPVAVSTTQPLPPQQKHRAAVLNHEPTTTTTTSTLVPLDRRQADLAAFSRGDRGRPHHNAYAYDDDDEDNEDDYDEEGDENDGVVVSPPPRKTRRAQMHHQSGLTAPFGSDTDTSVKCRSHLPNAHAYTAGTVSSQLVVCFLFVCAASMWALV